MRGRQWMGVWEDQGCFCKTYILNEHLQAFPSSVLLSLLFIHQVGTLESAKGLSPNDLKYLAPLYLMPLHDFLLFSLLLHYFPPSVHHMLLLPTLYNFEEVFCACNSVTNLNHCVIPFGHSVWDYHHFTSVFLWLERVFFFFSFMWSSDLRTLFLRSYLGKSLSFLTLYWPLE